MTNVHKQELGEGRELVLTRLVDAPPTLVFEAWTDAKQLAQWWGPKGFTNPICEIDPRPGGVIHIVMRAPDGVEHPMPGTVLEVVKPNRLVLKTAVDKNGKRVLETHNTVTFTEQGGKTLLTMRMRVVKATDEAVPMLAGAEQGWTETLERLAAYCGQGVIPKARS